MVVLNMKLLCPYKNRLNSFCFRSHAEDGRVLGLTPHNFVLFLVTEIPIHIHVKHYHVFLIIIQHNITYFSKEHIIFRLEYFWTNAFFKFIYKTDVNHNFILFKVV